MISIYLNLLIHKHIDRTLMQTQKKIDKDRNMNR